MKSFLKVVFVACVMGCVGSHADTVRFKDGTTIDGVVSRPNQDVVTIKVGSGVVSVPACDVEAIEPNDKKGDPGASRDLAYTRRAKFLEERTGLNRAQRDMARDAIALLWSPDEAERNGAREKLIAMGQEMPVFQFIEASLPYSKGNVVPELMRVMVQLDPERARQTLSQRSEDVDPRNRAQALELLAGYEDADDAVDTFARGMVDPVPAVQMAAATALASAAGKRATPALLEGLSSADLKVQNTCREALTRIWSTSDAKVELKTSEEWNNFWATRRAGVENPIDSRNAEPLVSEEALAAATRDFDE